MNDSRKILCQLTDIPEGSSRGFSLTSDRDVQNIFIVKRKNQLFAYKNQCPHTGVTLNWLADNFMDFENHYIQCAVHGARFEVESGRCVWGPCVNQSLTPIDLEISDDFTVSISTNVLR